MLSQILVMQIDVIFSLSFGIINKMSRYRAPLVIELASHKKSSKKTCLYQLPFKKDEPFEERDFTLVKTNRDELMIAANIKLPKIMMSLHSNRASQMTGKLSNRQQIGIQSSLNDHDEYDQKEEPKETTVAKQVAIQASQSQIDEDRVTSSEDEKPIPYQIDIPIIKSNSPIILPNKSRRRYLSQVNKYPDYTFIEPDYSETSQYEQTNTRLWRGSYSPLAVVDSSKNFKTQIEEVDAQDEGEEGEDPRIKEWRLLTTKIREYEQQKIKKQNQKTNPKTKSKKRIFFSLSKRPKLNISDRQALESQVTKIHLAKSNKILQNGKSDIYLDKKESFNMPSSLIPKDQQKVPNINNANISIEKIKKSAEFKPNKKKITKGKLPLQFYIPSYELVKQVNPFFRKLNQFGGCIILSIGKVIYLEAGKQVYCEDSSINEIYIIVYGKILLSNKYETLKIYAQTGETLAEEELFQGQNSYNERLKYGLKTQNHREEARTVTKCCLLKISLRKYYKMYRHLQRAGCKQLFNLIDNLFRINYIKKLRSQHPHSNDRLSTEILSTKPSNKKCFF